MDFQSRWTFDQRMNENTGNFLWHVPIEISSMYPILPSFELIYIDNSIAYAWLKCFPLIKLYVIWKEISLQFWQKFRKCTILHILPHFLSERLTAMYLRKVKSNMIKHGTGVCVGRNAIHKNICLAYSKSRGASMRIDFCEWRDSKNCLASLL